MPAPRLIRVLCIAALSAGAGSAVAAPETGERPVFLGQHILYYRSFDGLPDDIFDGLRIWGAEGTTWSQLEPQKGRFDFGRFDAYVAAATARRLDLIYTLGQTPRWASARPDEKGNTGLGAAAEPADMGDWARYVRTVATRYRGKIGAYEVMNEPRVPEAMKSWSPGFFSGSVARLADMTQIAAAEIRAADPAARVVCPAFDGFDGLKRFETFLATGAGRHCDVIGFHYYLPRHTLQELRTMIRETHRIAARHDLGQLPIWDTETGVLIADAGFNLTPQFRTGALSRMFDSPAAARLAAKVLVISHLSGVERTYWFAHDTSWMGSTVADKRRNQLNPFGASLRLLRNWLSGRTLRGCVEGQDSLVCEVVGRSGKAGAIYWGRGKTPADWRRAGYERVEYLDGTVASLEGLDASAAIPRLPEDVIFLYNAP